MHSATESGFTPSCQAQPAEYMCMPREEFRWFCVTALLLCFVVPLWIWLALPSSGSFNTNAFVSLMIAEYCGIRLAFLAASRLPFLLATTFYVFIYVWGGIAAFAQNYADIFPWAIRHTHDDALYGLLEIFLTVLAYEVGTSLVRQKQFRGPQLADNGTLILFSHKQALILSLITLPLVIVGIILLGGADVLFTTRGGYGAAVSASGGTKLRILLGSAFMQVPPFVVFVIMCIIVKRDWAGMSQTRKRLFFWLLIYTTVINAVANYPVSLPRQWLGTVVLTPLFALMPWQKQWAIGSLGIGLVALILFVFPYADAYRRQTNASEEALSQALEASVIQNVLNKGDFDVYQQTLNGLVVTSHKGFSYGENFLGAAFFWFPREFWPSKPIGTGFQVAMGVGYPWHQTNLSAPLWMEAHWAFSWLGVALILCLYGYASRHLDLSYVRARAIGNFSSMILLVVPFFAAYQFIFVRGDLIHGTARATFVVLFLLGAVRLWRRAVTAPQVPDLRHEGIRR
jgi:hypothetical protein